MNSALRILIQKFTLLFHKRKARQHTHMRESKPSVPRPNLGENFFKETPAQKTGATTSDADTHLVVNDFYNLIGSLTDLCDELKMCSGRVSEQPSVEQFRQMLIDKMELAEVQLIQQDIWDGSKQRAVKIDSNNGSDIKVLSSTRTGVSYRNKIIRKEEVIISK